MVKLRNESVSMRITNGTAEGGIGSPPLFNNIGSEAADRFSPQTQVNSIQAPESGLQVDGDHTPAIEGTQVDIEPSGQVDTEPADHPYPPGGKQVENHVFADDMNLMKSGKNIWHVAVHIQLAVNHLCEWAKENNLQFNADKTKVMIFTRKYKYEKPIILINRK